MKSLRKRKKIVFTELNMRWGDKYRRDAQISDSVERKMNLIGSGKVASQKEGKGDLSVKGRTNKGHCMIGVLTIPHKSVTAAKVLLISQ